MKPQRPLSCPGLIASVLALFTIAVLVLPTARAQQDAPAGYRAYQLRHIQADSIAQEVRRILPASPEVLVDHHMNRLLVKEDGSSGSLVSDLVRTLDIPPRVSSAKTSSQSSDLVQGYPIDAEELESTHRQLQSTYSSRAGVRIAIDQRTSQLVVVAPAATQQEINSYLTVRGLLQQAGEVFAPVEDAPLDLGPPSRHRHMLQHLSWREFEDGIDRIWAKQLVVSTMRNGELAMLSLPAWARGGGKVQVDRRANVITVDGPQRLTKAWARLIEILDVPKAEDDQGDTRIFPFRRADPAKIQRAVALLQSLSGERKAGQTTAVMRLANRDVAQGWGGDLLSKIFQPANMVQVQDAQPNQPQAQPGPADPLAEEPAADTGLIGDVQIEFLEELGQIIVRGNPRDVARVEQLIQEIIEQSRRTQPVVELVRLQYANSQAIADVVTPLYESVYAPRQGPISITPVVNPNGLLLVGQKENVDSTKLLVRQLDQPAPGTSQFEVFHLRYMSAVDAQTRITEFFTGDQAAAAQPQAAAAGVAISPRVQVVADYRSNALIVKASPNDMAVVAKMIQEMDIVDDAGQNEVKVFKLRNALSEELAPVLQDALNGQLQGAGRSDIAGVGVQGVGAGQIGQAQVAQVRSAMLSLMTVDAETGRLLKSGIMFDVRVTPDTNSNSLIVTGPAENMELIEALIKELDRLPDAETNVKVFTIFNGDATTLLDTLETLFGQDQAGFGAQGAIGQLPLQTGAGDTSLVSLRFALDVRTNSIIVSGSEGDLNVVGAILSRLDLDAREERDTRVFRLRNAPALDVSNAINDFLDGRRTINQIDPAVISPFEQTEREVIVVPEIVSNSLIVSATPEFFAEIDAVIKELDRRPPMVIIQALIAEIELDAFDEFGVEIGLQESLLFDRGIGVVGFPFNQAAIGNNADVISLRTRDVLAGQALGNFSLGRTNQTLGYGGLVLSAGNDSVNILLRALQDQQRMQILSRPQLMTLDNIQGSVLVGSRVPFVTGVSTVNNVTTNTIEFEDVGIQLIVTPRTSPDGLIVMSVVVVKSELGPIDEGIPIFTDAFGNVVRSPQIDTITGTTTISARSGQTAVFAGLITKSTRSVRRGTPFLSDLPGLGWLFRYDVEADQRQELLIFLTPYIVESDEDIAFVNRTETERLNWCFADVLSVHGEAALSLSSGQLNTQQPEVIYPDLDPTGTEGVVNPAGEPVFDPNDIVIPPVIDQSSDLEAHPADGAKTATRPSTSPVSQSEDARRTQTDAPPPTDDRIARPYSPVAPMRNEANQPDFPPFSLQDELGISRLPTIER